MLRYTDDTFSETEVSTVGIDFKTRTVRINDVDYQIQIWDTAGQERFRNIVEIYYRRAEGIALVYDVTSRDSFEELERWFKSIKQHANKGVPVIICGNKYDQESLVPKEEAEQYGASKNCEIFLTSAKSGELVNEAFFRLAELVLQSTRVEPGQSPPEKKKKRLPCTI
jgi:small GTP-binding protein